MDQYTTLHWINTLVEWINPFHSTERIDTNDLYKIIINIYLVNICKLILNYIVIHCNSNVTTLKYIVIPM